VTSWREVVEKARTLEDVRTGLAAVDGIFHDSVHLIHGTLLFLMKESLVKQLIIISTDHGADPFEGETLKLGAFAVKQAVLSDANAKALRSLLPWTAPQAFGTSGISMGLGDRLGLASPGHLKALKGTTVRPVLAQQSMRELDLTNRTYVDVLDAATWAVFQEGYQGGYGADGDHLKKIEDIQEALELGFSMITLDCSEYINDGVLSLTDAEVLSQYNDLPEEARRGFEELYRGQSYGLRSGLTLVMDPEHYQRMILTYHKALDFIVKVFEQVIMKVDRPIDFEVSIDEVATPTTPQDHFFVAHELQKRGVRVCSLAPRFCGYFEKGIDYRGNLQQFEEEFAVHADIADHFGYKLSIHSGSDKFSVFPIIGKYAKDTGYHVKTAGTNWLEAVRVIAHVDPDLYRILHHKALESLEDARRYYHVSIDLAKVPGLDSLKDEELPGLLNQDDARQLLHITYGFMLQDPELKEAIYQVLRENEGQYEEFLVRHINRHLQTLGIKD